MSWLRIVLRGVRDCLCCDSQYVWKNNILFRVVSGKIISFSTPKCLESLENWCLKTCGNPVERSKLAFIISNELKFSGIKNALESGICQPDIS